MRRLAASCWLLAAALAPRPAAPEDADSRAAALLESYVSAHAANGDFSGVVLVTRNGKPLYERSIGLASRAFEVPNSAATRFPVASVTKTFTAAAIAILEREGKLKSSDELEAYLPALALADGVTLLHLLAHRSGLADPDYDTIATRSITADELLAMIDDKPRLFEPGTVSRYSNAGYVALARVIERASGRSFGDFLGQRIFSPLGMEDTGTLRSGVVVPRLAEGYVPGVGSAVLKPPPRDPSSLFGSGNVYATAADLDRWLGAIDANELFDLEAQAYPFGWGVRTWFGQRVLVQSGIDPGYSSVVLTVPAERLHVISLLNVQSGFNADEGRSLLGIVTGTPATLPARRDAPATVRPELLERYAGRYLWGEARIPLHVATDGEGLTLRWADATSFVALTPLSEVEFLDRTSFGRIRFHEDGLVWTQNGADTPAERVHPAANVHE
jgi:CubicO group peptidase (beta-lactamase class C family)